MKGPKVEMELRRKTKTVDTMGGHTLTWAGLRYVTGVMSTIRGAERLSSDKLTVIADFYYFIDYPIGETITEEDIFQYGTRLFKIIHINNLGSNMNRPLTITLKEEV